MTTPNVTLNADGSLTYYENSPTGLYQDTMDAATVKSEEQLVQWWVQNNFHLTTALSPGMAAVSDLAIQNGMITADQFNTWVTDNEIQAYTYSGTPSTSSTVTSSATSVANDPTVTSGGVPTQTQATSNYTASTQNQASSELTAQQSSSSSTAPGPTLTTTHSTVDDTVQTAYIAYYGRPADPAGLAFWVNQLQAAGGNLDAIINAFGNSAESQSLYAGQSVTQIITSIYEQQFGRTPDASGLAYWTKEISSGAVSAASAALSIFNGATGLDKTTIDNKLVVADAYTDALSSNSLLNTQYAGNTAGVNARGYLSAVGTDTTMTAKLASIASQVASDINNGISSDLASIGATADTARALIHTDAVQVTHATPVVDVHLVGLSHASVELLHA